MTASCRRQWRKCFGLKQSPIAFLMPLLMPCKSYCRLGKTVFSCTLCKVFRKKVEITPDPPRTFLQNTALAVIPLAITGLFAAVSYLAIEIPKAMDAQQAEMKIQNLKLAQIADLLRENVTRVEGLEERVRVIEREVF
jgi:hypothetical protein